MARIVVFGSQAESLVNFRGELIRHLLARGHEVICLAPSGGTEVDATLARWGARRLFLPLQRTGSNPLYDLSALRVLTQLLRAERPDLVLAYTVKPVVYGAIAARRAGVPRMAAMITGLGIAFAAPRSLRQRLIGFIARGLYRVAMRRTCTVFFQNPDNEAVFRGAGLLSPGQTVLRTAGSGVNLERFAAQPLPPGLGLRFLMIARLLADKGVREYLEAAAAVRGTHPQAEFHLVGPFDQHPSSIRPDEVAAAVAQGAVYYHGWADDVKPHLAACHVYVLPSYHEGTPRSVLEAMAVGRPIVTTDAPGCRETVRPGENGLLVPPAQAALLADAMRHMLEMPRDELERMAARSRCIAEEVFDVAIVNTRISSALDL